MKHRLNLGDKIKALRKYKHMTQGVFSSHIGLTTSSLSQMESNRIEPSLKTLYKIAKVFNINTNWLVMNEGTMLREKMLKTIRIEDLPPPEIDAPTYAQKGNITRSAAIAGLSGMLGEPSYNNVVFVPQKAQAGYLEAENIDDYMKQLPASHIPGMEGKVARGFQIKGNSMDYSISHGDWVLCERTDNVWHIHDGAIYLLLTKKEFICKRVVNKVREQGMLVLKSDNEYYGEQHLSVNDIKEVWAVEAKISRDFNQVNQAMEKKNMLIRSLKDTIHDNGKVIQGCNESLRIRDEHINTLQAQIRAMENIINHQQALIDVFKEKMSPKKT